MGRRLGVGFLLNGDALDHEGGAITSMRPGLVYVGLCARKKPGWWWVSRVCGVNWVGAWVPSVEGMSLGFFASLRRPAVLGGSRGRKHPSPAWTQFWLSRPVDWWIIGTMVGRSDSRPWVSVSTCLVRPWASLPGMLKGRVFGVIIWWAIRWWAIRLDSSWRVSMRARTFC